MTDTVFDITGKVTIVTGGGTGIGADIAREFCTRGARRVCIHSRRAIGGSYKAASKPARSSTH